MQFGNGIVSCKLLLGLCLLLLTDKVISAPMTTYEQDQLKNQLSIQTDKLFNGRLNCPSYVADQVKHCIMAVADEENEEVCTIMKSVWSCQRSGVLKCENGQNLWKFTAPILENVGKSLGCSDMNLRAENKPQTEYETTTAVPIIEVIPTIKSAIHLLSEASISSSPTYEDEESDTLTSLERNSHYTLLVGILLVGFVLVVIGFVVIIARNRASAANVENPDYEQLADKNQVGSWNA